MNSWTRTAVVMSLVTPEFEGVGLHGTDAIKTETFIGKYISIFLIYKNQRTEKTSSTGKPQLP